VPADSYLTRAMHGGAFMHDGLIWIRLPGPKVLGIPPGRRRAAGAELPRSRETPPGRGTGLPGSMQAGSMQVGAECRADGADCFPLLGGIMIIEVAVPDDWTPGQALAVRQLLQHALRNAQPVIALVRKDVTPDELRTSTTGSGP
jgi:hypothetical protein